MGSRFFNTSFDANAHVWAVSTRNTVVCTVAITNYLVVFVLLAAFSDLKRTTKIVLLNLLGSDIYMITSGLVYAQFVQTHLGSDHPFCQMSAFLMGSGSVISHAAVTGVSLNNFLTIFYPFKHDLLVTTKSVSIAVVVTWGALLSLSVCFAVVNLPSNGPCHVLANVQSFHLLFAFVILLTFDLCVIVMNIYLCVILRRRRKIHVNDSSTMPQSLTSGLNNITGHTVESSRRIEDVSPTPPCGEGNSPTICRLYKPNDKTRQNRPDLLLTKLRISHEFYFSVEQCKNSESQQIGEQRKVLSISGHSAQTENPVGNHTTRGTSACEETPAVVRAPGYTESPTGPKRTVSGENRSVLNRRDRHTGFPILNIPKERIGSWTKNFHTNAQNVSERNQRDSFHSLSTSLVIVSLWYCFLNIPFLMYIFYLASFVDDRYSVHFSPLGLFFTALGSLIRLGDPFIYAWRFVKWRNVFGKIKKFKKRCCCMTN